MADETNYKNIEIQALFGRNLKRLRTNAKLSQMDLADVTELAHNFINEIENGRKWVSAKTIGKFVKALKAEPYQFFINEAELNEEEKNNLKFYLNDITDNLTKVVIEYRNSYLMEESKNAKNQ